MRCTDFALNLCVSIITRRTKALGLMENNATHCVYSTSSAHQTWIHALVFETVVVHITISINLTLILYAFWCRIASKTIGTQTYWPVIRNTTFSISSARIALTWVCTLTTETSFLWRTISVRATSSYARVSTAHLPLWTLVISSALKTATTLHACFTAITRRSFGTGCCAETGNTFGSIGTICILRATSRCLEACQLRITDCSSRASALSRMIDHIALRTRTTYICHLTRICKNKIWVVYFFENCYFSFEYLKIFGNIDQYSSEV